MYWPELNEHNIEFPYNVSVEYLQYEDMYIIAALALDVKREDILHVTDRDYYPYTVVKSNQQGVPDEVHPTMIRFTFYYDPSNKNMYTYQFEVDNNLDTKLYYVNNDKTRTLIPVKYQTRLASKIIDLLLGD